MKKSGKRQESPEKDWGMVMWALLRGSIIALAAVLVLLLACSAAASGGLLSQGALSRAGMAACVLGGLLGGGTAMYGRRELALPLGLGTGGGLFFLLLLLGTLLFEGAPQPGNIPSILCACMCGGGMAGIFGRKTRKKRRR